MKTLAELDTRTPEQIAADDATKKEKQRERYINYQREYSLKNAEAKREYAREHRKRLKEEKEFAIAEACAQVLVLEDYEAAYCFVVKEPKPAA